MKSQTSQQIDLVILALSRWDNSYSSTALALAKEFAKCRRVFLIDNPFTVKDVLTRHDDKQVKRRKNALLLRKNVYRDIGGPGRQLTVVITPPVLPINFLPFGRTYRWLSQINEWIVFNTIRKMMRHFAIKDFIFINIFNPFYCRCFPDFFSPRLFVYYTMDDMAHSRYVAKHGTRLEAEAMNRAHFTLATSRELAALATRNAQNVYYLPNGVDHGVFLRNADHHERPPELKDVEQPIIMFVGNCDNRLDYKLLQRVAEVHADKVLVIVGPHSLAGVYIDTLRTCSNVIVIGTRAFEEIPNYLASAACLVIPYVCNELTNSIYPLKLNEYLASGRPVVATPFSKDVIEFQDVVFISKSSEDFCLKINESIETDELVKQQARKRVASQNKWECRAERFWELVEDYLQKKPLLSISNSAGEVAHSYAPTS